MHRDAEEQVVGQPRAVVQDGLAAIAGSSDATRRPGTNPIPRSANRARIASDVSGDGGIGDAERDHDLDRHVVADAALAQVRRRAGTPPRSAPAGT